MLAGIGMNVQHTPPGLPYAVTSLSALGCTAGPEAIIAALASAMAAEWALWRAEGFGHTLERWMARGPMRGARLTIRQGGAPLTGPYAGLRADGALLLDLPGGRRAFVAGDVQPCAPTPP